MPIRFTGQSGMSRTASNLLRGIRMSNSINTNFAAQTALASLNSTNKSMLETQKRISTGFRVASAEDNAAYWSMATSMRADNKSLSAVNDALGIGAATIDVAYTGMNARSTSSRKWEPSSLPPASRASTQAKVQSEIDELQNQLRSIATGATIAGQNWLCVDTGGRPTRTETRSSPRSPLQLRRQRLAKSRSAR